MIGDNWNPCLQGSNCIKIFPESLAWAGMFAGPMFSVVRLSKFLKHGFVQEVKQLHEYFPQSCLRLGCSQGHRFSVRSRVNVYGLRD